MGHVIAISGKEMCIRDRWKQMDFMEHIGNVKQAQTMQ